MITNNVVERTFRIRYDGILGTGFAIDRDGKQYLITARHVVNGITSGDKISIFHEKQWKEIAVNVVGVGAEDIDVTVLACSAQLAPQHILEASTYGIGYGQLVYFLGFPFDWYSGGEEANRNFPMPFVKAGIISAMVSRDSKLIYIDGHVNEGFSGGPVVFMPNDRSPNKFIVAGVVANYPATLRPVVDSAGKPILNADNNSIAYFPENSGFVVAFQIEHATDLIDANPIGFELPSEQDG